MPRHSSEPPASRARMTPEERRRQLLGIGLRKFVDRPVQELSLDEVAAEAGVSRGLLFHYFPTKTAYHEAVVAAAGRRVLRTLRPDDGVTGEAAVRQIVERFVAQVDRRRGFYLAFVYGQIGLPAGAAGPRQDVAIGLRRNISGLVCTAMGYAAPLTPVVHAWVAYVEDLALQHTEPGTSWGAGTAPLVDYCVALLPVLVALGPPA